MDCPRTLQSGRQGVAWPYRTSKGHMLAGMSKQVKARRGCTGRRVAVGRGLAAAAVLAVVWSSPAPAQEGGALVDRLQRLERDMRTLQRQVYQGSGGGQTLPSGAVPATASPKNMPTDVASRLQVRMGELERLIQELTGRVETAQFGVDRLEKRLDGLQSDIDFRLSRIEQKVGLSAVAGPPPQGAFRGGGQGAMAPAGTPGAAGQGAAGGGRGSPEGVLGYLPGTETRNDTAAGGAGGAGAQQPDRPENQQAGQQMAALPDAPPREQYAYAFGLLRKGDFAKAETALQAFIDQHPEHELAGNAQYWLGETYYVRGDYKRAAVAFLDGYKTYPDSPKGPDNLLKLGMTMGALGQKDNACAALGRLTQEYPGASDVVTRRAASERASLGCK